MLVEKLFLKRKEQKKLLTRSIVALEERHVLIEELSVSLSKGVGASRAIQITSIT